MKCCKNKKEKEVEEGGGGEIKWKNPWADFLPSGLV